jgi:hypothetical protein
MSSELWPKALKAAVFDDPWSKANIAIAYAHQLKDGVGAQTMRMLEIYAVANSLGIGYLHRPITCVGHIGDLVHYRESACNLTREADVRLLNKIRRMITLPSTVTEEQVGDCSAVLVESHMQCQRHDDICQCWRQLQQQQQQQATGCGR